MSLQAKKYQKGDEEADELIRRMQTGVVPEQPAIQPEANPDDNTPGEQDAVPVEIPAEPNVAAPVPALQDTDETSKLKDQLAASEHRYRTLQGMMEKVTEDNRELRGTVRDLTEKLQAFLESQQRKAEETPKSLVTDKDEEAFGSDLVDLVRRAAKETLQSTISDIDGKLSGKVDEVSNRMNQVAQTVAETAQERFESSLAGVVADWREINLDPNFSVWLGTYGLKALNEAYANADVAGTAQFFTNYKLATGKQEAETPPPAPPSSKLEGFVAPGKTKAASPIPQPKTYTIADWNDAFELNRRGKLSDADLETFEKEFNKAQREGRVV
jgi:uncharacterized phage infection (PIP) family protein YhgE